MSLHDQRCSERADDWDSLWQQIKIFPHGRILHKAWNILVEEWRRWTGKCPKQPDEHEDGV